MKRTIAIIAGGDTSEFYVSLRSAQGIYSFIDKEKYNLYIVEMEGLRWEVQLPDGKKAPVDRNDFSFVNGTDKVKFDLAYITNTSRLLGFVSPNLCCFVRGSLSRMKMLLRRSDYLVLSSPVWVAPVLA